MALQKQVIQLIKEVAFKYNLPPYVVEKILTSEFKAIKEWIQSGNFETIHLTHWGKYTPSKNKLKRRDEKLREANKDTSNTLS